MVNLHTNFNHMGFPHIKSHSPYKTSCKPHVIDFLIVNPHVCLISHVFCVIGVSLLLLSTQNPDRGPWLHTGHRILWYLWVRELCTLWRLTCGSLQSSRPSLLCETWGIIEGGRRLLWYCVIYPLRCGWAACVLPISWVISKILSWHAYCKAISHYLPLICAIYGINKWHAFRKMLQKD